HVAAVSLALTVGVILTLGRSIGVSGGTLVERLLEAMLAKQWVTAFLESTRPKEIPARDDLLVAKVGGQERVIYRARADDLVIAGPIVSPDGTKLAFVKIDRIAGPEDKPYYTAEESHKRIYTMNVDGSDLRAWVELTSLR